MFSSRQSTTSTAPLQRLRPVVVGLVRVSTLAQAEDGHSGLARQYTVIRRTVEQKGLDLKKIYEVVDVSGTDVLRCPAIQEILSLVEQQSIQGICIADLDRLFRPDKPSDYAILGVFQTTGAIIYSGDSELDLSTKNGMLFSHIRSAISGYELSLMKERQQGAKEEKRRAGKCPTNNLTMPFGTEFDRTLDKWTYTPDIVRVQHLFQLFDSEGVHNYRELGRRLGIDAASIKIILANQIYTGVRVISKRRGEKRVSRNGKTYRQKVARSADEVISVKVFDTPAVSQEVFDRVQLEMRRTKFNHNERYRKNMVVKLGTGLLVCGCCGEPFFGSSAKGPEGQLGKYVCRANHYLYKARLGGCKQPNLRLAQVDGALLKLAQNILGNPENLGEMLMASLARQKSVIRPISGIAPSKTLAEDIQKRDKRLLDAFESGAISVDELKTRRADLRQQMDALKSDVPEVEHKSSVLESARLIVKSALRFQLIRDRAEQKSVLQKMLSQVIVRGNHITAFTFKDTALPPSSVLLGHAITLEKPLEIFQLPEQLPDGKRRCIKCNAIRDTESQFYKKLNVCNCCRSAAAREHYKKRKLVQSPED